MSFYNSRSDYNDDMMLTHNTNNYDELYDETDPSTNWEWDSKENRLEFDRIRRNSLVSERFADFAIAGLIINRIVSVIDLQLTDLFISGLRLENQFQFIGLQKNIFSLFYPSRTLDLPFYPFIKLYDIKIPIEDYNSNGNKKGIYSYNSKMIGVGFGVQFINKWFLGIEK